jgi:hypothetical protein
MKHAQQAEPPSLFRPPVFMIGQNRRGDWVVQDQKGIAGGLFVTRDAALCYIRSENGYQAASTPDRVMTLTAIGCDISRLSGYAPALPTPFNQEGNIDAAAFERLCDSERLAKPPH